MKKTIIYSNLILLQLLMSHITSFAQENPKNSVNRILTASQTTSLAKQPNKVFTKQFTTPKQALKSNTHLSYTLPSKKFHYVGGKPFWVSPYDKNIYKPLSSISNDFKRENTFYKSLYQIQETPFQADIEAKIFFQSGEHTLSARNQTQFNNLLKVIYQTLQAHLQKDSKNALKITIEVAGFTDSKPFYAQQPQEERKKSNLLLSQKRAEQVAAYLLGDLQGKVAQVSAKIEGYGETIPSFSTQHSISDEHRRLCFVRVYFSSFQDTLPIKQPVYEDLSTMPGR